MTITEALAEIKTITKRIQSKREFIETYQLRVDSLKDPLDKDGGSVKAVSEASQSISDLEDRMVALRSAIASANNTNTIALEGVEKPISDWLIWRREIAPGRERFLIGLASKLASARNSVAGQKYRWGDAQKTDDKPVDIIVNVDETALNVEREQMKNILGQLDGQLSLKNATIMLSI